MQFRSGSPDSGKKLGRQQERHTVVLSQSRKRKVDMSPPLFRYSKLNFLQDFFSSNKGLHSHSRMC